MVVPEGALKVPAGAPFTLNALYGPSKVTATWVQVPLLALGLKLAGKLTVD